MEILLKLFLSFLKIGAFSFGGGYAMLPFIEREVVEVNGWLTGTEFLDIIGISQATPGPIAINTATFVGYKTAGLAGSIVSTIGVVTASFFLVLTAAHFMTKFRDSTTLKNALRGMRPALVALILNAALSTARTVYIPLNIRAIVIGALTLFLLLKSRIHPIIIILISALLGIVFYGVIPALSPV